LYIRTRIHDHNRIYTYTTLDIISLNPSH
jgi:hypothetical protein